MPVYSIFIYDVIDPIRFSKYAKEYKEAIYSNIANFGGEVIFADDKAVFRKGKKKSMCVGIKFPSIHQATAWEYSTKNQEAKGHRLASTANYTSFIVNGFDSLKEYA